MPDTKKIAKSWRLWGEGRLPLSWRLILVAAIWSMVTLFVAGWILVALFRGASLQALDDQLNVHMTAIIQSMARDLPGPPRRPSNLGEARFELPVSGWYWTIRDGQQNQSVVFDSLSLFGDQLNLPQLPKNGKHPKFIVGPGGQELRLVMRRIEFSGGKSYVIAVAGSTKEVTERTAGFARVAGLTLMALGFGLIGAIILQVRYGLLPVNRLAQSLSNVRRGEADNIDEDMPKELKPLAVELNALIKSNHEIVERARTQVGNLAHGLKTPLSVITNEANVRDDPLARKVMEQTDMMRNQINHYLEQARMAAQRRVIGVSCEVEPVVRRLANAMEKIHRDKDLDIVVKIDSGLTFRGEQHDLEEMVGNLLDNACKWCDGNVTIEGKSTEGEEGGRELLLLEILDDGPGLSAEQKEKSLKRGRRLDESVPGSGLGLSIVVDIAEVYGGKFSLADSPMGGLGAILELPSISAAAK
ncbi:histidine kinase [Rhodobacteraceae bacterium RKSG542]|uniref:ATP-binding protein n=1 Tax=Pseudovibrio flavus TaxID=2529854 RepID=UPI0012BD22EB|nr:ATP-binding protein [Pseudovibrio flavus]MTI17048.1 histidine kinase [Pseudovibrio flavus]